MKRLFNLILAVLLLVGTTTAQSLSVTSVSAEVGEQTNIEVSVSGASSMTALQFNLSLPSGVAIDGEITLDAAISGYTLDVQSLATGDYLVVLYSMNLNTFGDGVLLNIPVVAGENGGTESGSLYNVRMSTVDAVSHKCDDASFKVTVNAPTTGIDEVKYENGEVKTIYDLQGRKVDTSSKGLYIINGKKVLVK